MIVLLSHPCLIAVLFSCRALLAYSSDGSVPVCHCVCPHDSGVYLPCGVCLQKSEVSAKTPVSELGDFGEGLAYCWVPRQLESFLFVLGLLRREVKQWAMRSWGKWRGTKRCPSKRKRRGQHWRSDWTFSMMWLKAHFSELFFSEFCGKSMRLLITRPPHSLSSTTMLYSWLWSSWPLFTSWDHSTQLCILCLLFFYWMKLGSFNHQICSVGNVHCMEFLTQTLSHWLKNT